MTVTLLETMIRRSSLYSIKREVDFFFFLLYKEEFIVIEIVLGFGFSTNLYVLFARDPDKLIYIKFPLRIIP